MPEPPRSNLWGGHPYDCKAGKGIRGTFYKHSVKNKKMKLERKDIEGVSKIDKFVKRTTDASDVFVEQNKQNAYMIVYVEEVDVNGEKKLLTHASFGGNVKNLSNAISQCMKECEKTEAVIMTAAGTFARSQITEALEKLKKKAEGLK